MQLPFALVPLIKFVSSEKIMGEFVVPKYQIAFASAFGFLLFIMNFVMIFSTSATILKNPIILVSIIVVSTVYIGLIITVIFEQIKPLRKLTQKEMEDHEYDRISVEDDFINETSPPISDEIQCENRYALTKETIKEGTPE